MLAALGLIVASYLFPILIGALARTDIPYASWTDGTFTEVGWVVCGDCFFVSTLRSPRDLSKAPAPVRRTNPHHHHLLKPPSIPNPHHDQIGRQVGGDWLAGAIVLSAAVSNVGLYLAEMSSDAFQVSTYACPSVRFVGCSGGWVCGWVVAIVLSAAVSNVGLYSKLVRMSVRTLHPSGGGVVELSWVGGGGALVASSVRLHAMMILKQKQRSLRCSVCHGRGVVFYYRLVVF